jgi:hypothetical protein
MKRVFYVECSGSIWRGIAERCKSHAGWEPVLWTAKAEDAPRVFEAFPQTFFVAGPDATLGLQHGQTVWPLSPIPLETIAALAQEESIALHMMDRMDPACGAGFPHDERRRHWYDLLKWWSAAIEHLKPDLIVFSISPHVIFDYALLVLARHRGISTLMFERPGLPGWVFPISDYVEGSNAIRAAIRSKPLTPVDSVPGDFGAWLRDSLNGAAAVPANFRKKIERYRLVQGAPSHTRALAHEFKRALVLWRRHGVLPANNSYLRSTYSPHGRAGQLETLFARLRGVCFKRGLLRHYDRLARLPNEEDDYVFLALHYQPERATVPMGGHFGDQLVIVEWLLATLPAGWKLYIKEHPWQLQSFSRGEVQRSKSFYDRLSRKDNVVLVPGDIGAAGLVRDARAVATVTGSVGWDALCSGVPVLVFGAAWYRDCPGVHEVKCLNGLKSEFEQIRAGARPRLEAVAAFTEALSKICVPGVLEREVEDVTNIDENMVASSMALALISTSN